MFISRQDQKSVLIEFMHHPKQQDMHVIICPVVARLELDLFNQCDSSGMYSLDLVKEDHN